MSYSNRTGLQAFGGFSTNLEATFPTISHYDPEKFQMVPEKAPGPWAVSISTDYRCLSPQMEWFHLMFCYNHASLLGKLAVFPS